MFYESITSQSRVNYESITGLLRILPQLIYTSYISRDFDFLYTPRPIGT